MAGNTAHAPQPHLRNEGRMDHGNRASKPLCALPCERPASGCEAPHPILVMSAATPTPPFQFIQAVRFSGKTTQSTEVLVAGPTSKRKVL